MKSFKTDSKELSLLLQSLKKNETFRIVDLTVRRLKPYSFYNEKLPPKVFGCSYTI
jgi:hypothetical protein